MAEKKKKYKAKYSGNVYSTKYEAMLDNRQYLLNPYFRFETKSSKLNHPIENEIPFIESKKRVLTNAGLATGAVISENLLDTIAKYADASGLPVKTALGLAVKESTLGNPTDDKSIYKLLSRPNPEYFKARGTRQNINVLGEALEPRRLVNFYADFDPYLEAIEYVERKNNSKDRYDKKNIELLELGENYADKKAKEYEQQYGNKHVLYNAFKFYKEHPNQYNSGQSNYQQLVNKRAEEVWNSPEIQQWWEEYNLRKNQQADNESTTANYKAEGGKLDSPLEWNNLSMKDRAAYIRKAVSMGLSSLDDIKQDYNIFRKGGPTTEQLKQRFLNTLDQTLKNYNRYNTNEWRKYLTDLAFAESSFIPDSTNSIGAKGYFQLMPAYRSAKWTTPTQQFEELFKLQDANMEYFKKNMTKKDLARANELGIDIYGLVAGAHLGGAPNALKALRGISNAKDANNSSVLGYMKKFSQSSLPASRERGMIPIVDNVKLPVEYPDALTVAPKVNQTVPLVASSATNPKLDIKNDDNISFTGTLPEVVVTPKPKRQDILNPQQLMDQLQALTVPYKPVELPKPPTASERLAQLNTDRTSLLQKDLEDTILRNTLSDNYDQDKLRRDLKDLQFYRRMNNIGAYGGNLYPLGGIAPIMNAPAALKIAWDATKKRLYRTVTPEGYHIPKATMEFIKGDTRDYNAVNPADNEVWAKYLQVPYDKETNFEPAIYRPTMGTATYDDVIKLKDESQILSNDILRQMLNHQKQTGKNTMLIEGNERGLGTYTVSLGEDENGKYISYYDDWDLNPFRGISAALNVPALSKYGDIVPGSHPFTVYGRRYYTDEELQNQKNYGGPLVTQANIYDGTSENSQQLKLGRKFWLDESNNPTWYDTVDPPIDGGSLSEVIVTPTDDQNWLFSKGKYERNSRKPLADRQTKKIVSDYIFQFDNEGGEDYNNRITRLADAIYRTNGVIFRNNDVKEGKHKNRAHYVPNEGTAYINDMHGLFAELAHPYQEWLGNNKAEDEYIDGNYDSDRDPRGGTRYAYPDTFEGETHGFFEPALREYIETGKIGRSLPILDDERAKQKIIPKDWHEVIDSATSWNRQATDKKIIVNPSQLPLLERIKYNLIDYPLLNKSKALREPSVEAANKFRIGGPVLDVMGIIQNAGDFVKFGYDTYNNVYK